MSAPVTAPAAALDLDFVRAQFPAFAEPSLEGWAFMENAGGSYPARATVDRLHDFYTACKVQPYAPYPASGRAGHLMDEARARLAAHLNVGEEELMVGPSTSQNTYVLAQAFAEMLEPGDEVIVTDQDHEANSGVWRRLEKRGMRVLEWKVDPDTGHLDPAALDRLLTERTKVVAFPHASNIVAEINPVAEIAAKVRAAGAVSVVDGVSAAPHGLPDVAALGCDIYLFSTYKTYGPHQGVMVVRGDLRWRLPNQGHWFNDGSARKRLVPAGPDHAQVAALAGMSDYLDALHAHHFAPEPDPAARARAVHEAMRAQEKRLTWRLMDALHGRNGIRVLGPIDPERRASTVALVHRRPGEELAAALAEHKVMAGGGDFYAVRLIRAMGVDPGHGVLRLSFVHYTTEAEIDQVAAALDAVL